MTDPAPSNDSSPLKWYAAGGVLVIAAIVLFTIDADPAYLFGSPLASLLIGGAGVGVGIFGHQRSRSTRPQE